MKNENRELEAMFLRPKPARLLVFARTEDKPYASILAKRIDCTYAHTVKLLGQMKTHGLVKFKKKGRIKYVNLTDFGNNLAADFEKLINKRMARGGGDQTSSSKTAKKKG